MKKLLNYREYAKVNGYEEDCLWKNWQQFANDHDMVRADWLADTELLIVGDEYNTDEIDTGMYRDFFGYYIVNRETYDDIREYDLDIPLFVVREIRLYVIGVPFYGTLWDDVELKYISDVID